VTLADIQKTMPTYNRMGLAACNNSVILAGAAVSGCLLSQDFALQKSLVDKHQQPQDGPQATCCQEPVSLRAHVVACFHRVQEAKPDEIVGNDVGVEPRERFPRHLLRNI